MTVPATQDPDDRQPITRAALFRERCEAHDGVNGRLREAVRATSKRALLGWKEPATARIPYERKLRSPDQEFVDLFRSMGVWIDHYPVERVVDGRRFTVERHRLVLPPHLLSKGSAFCWMIEDRIQGAPILTDLDGATGKDRLVHDLPPCGLLPDLVIEKVLPGGRDVYGHSFVDRLTQNFVKRPLETLCEQRIPNTVHSYRPRRSRFTALRAILNRLAQGYRYVQRGDIQKFFPSVTRATLLRALDAIMPEVLPDLYCVIEWCLSPPGMLRRPEGNPNRRPGQGEFSRIKPGLLQGSVLAPTLSNIVGAFVIDIPIRELQLVDEVVVIRYSDDFIILGRSEIACAKIMELIAILLADARLELNDKTMSKAVDVDRHPVDWLGKRLHGRSLQTPDSVIDRAIEVLVVADQVGPLYRREAFQILDELALDGPSGLRSLQDRLRKVGKHPALRHLDQVHRAWVEKRKVEPARDPDPEDEIDDKDHVVCEARAPPAA